MEAVTFAKWLKKQEERDDPVGDFARDTKVALKRDVTPNNNTLAWSNFLVSRSASREATEAFEKAWREYQRTGNQEKEIRESARLIREFTAYDSDTLTDLLSIIARDIEDAMLQCGATPGKDYKILDIFNMAVAIHAGRKDGPA